MNESNQGPNQREEREYLPSNIGENLRIMAENILKYKNNARTIEDLQRRQILDADYKMVLLEQEGISKEVFNFIAYQCARLNEAHSVNKT
jgi:hypothetical protein